MTAARLALVTADPDGLEALARSGRWHHRGHRRRVALEVAAAALAIIIALAIALGADVAASG